MEKNAIYVPSMTSLPSVQYYRSDFSTAWPGAVTPAAVAVGGGDGGGGGGAAAGAAAENSQVVVGRLHLSLRTTQKRGRKYGERKKRLGDFHQKNRLKMKTS